MEYSIHLLPFHSKIGGVEQRSEVWRIEDKFTKEFDIEDLEKI